MCGGGQCEGAEERTLLCLVSYYHFWAKLFRKVHLISAHVFSFPPKIRIVYIELSCITSALHNTGY